MEINYADFKHWVRPAIVSRFGPKRLNWGRQDIMDKVRRPFDKTQSIEDLKKLILHLNKYDPLLNLEELKEKYTSEKEFEKTIKAKPYYRVIKDKYMYTHNETAETFILSNANKTLEDSGFSPVDISYFNEELKLFFLPKDIQVPYDLFLLGFEKLFIFEEKITGINKNNLEDGSKHLVLFLIEKLTKKATEEEVTTILNLVKDKNSLSVEGVYVKIKEKTSLPISTLRKAMKEIKEAGEAEEEEHSIHTFANEEEIIEQLNTEEELNLIDNHQGTITLGDEEHFYFIEFVQKEFDHIPILVLDTRKVFPLHFDEERKLYTVDIEGITFIVQGKPVYYNKLNYLSKEGLIRIINSEKVDVKEWYKQAKELLKEYYDDDINEKYYDYDVCHAVKTYLSNKLGKAIYTCFFSEEEDTGKSTRQQTVAKLQYRGSFSGRSTMASIARKIHYGMTTSNIDEFDKRPKEEQQQVIGILNNGCYKGGTYEFVDTNKQDISEQSTELNVFSDKTLSTNSLYLDKTFLSRCIIRHCLRSVRKTKNSFEMPKEDITRFQKLTDDLYLIILDHWKELLALIEKQETLIEEEESLFGRRKDIYAIITGIYKFFTGKDDIKEGLLQVERLATSGGTEYDRNYYLFEYLALSFYTGKDQVLDEVTVMNKDIVAYLNQQLNLPEKRQIHSRTIGKLLRDNLLLVDESQSKRGSEGYEYTLNKDRFRSVLERKRFREKIANFLVEGRKLCSFNTFSSFSSLNPEVNELNEPSKNTEKKKENELNEPNELNELKLQTPPEKKRFISAEQKREILNFYENNKDRIPDKELLVRQCITTLELEASDKDIREIWGVT